MNESPSKVMKHQRWVVAGLGALLLPFVLLGVLSAMSRRPTNLGVTQEHLAPCPDTPNCVCTFDTDQEHGIESIPLTISQADAIAKLKSILYQQPRTKIVTETANYLHAECTSFLFRFVDDIEFYIDETNQKIHFRSASRTGKSDLGVNRTRMETLRQQYLAGVGQ